MSNKKLKKYCCQKDNAIYVIEEDSIGWYLIVYNKKDENKSSEDYLFDTFEDAFFEAKDKFDIPENSWKEVLVENDKYLS